jgi:cytochrome c-type biogenesis protein CcmH/NrfF
VIVRPLVAWIWIGGLMLLFGAFVAISPSMKELLERVQNPLKSGGVLARPALASWLAWLLGVLLTLSVIGAASAQDSSSLMAGNVTMKTPEEKQLFERVLCQCGGCARLPLSSCICEWAEKKRSELLLDIAAGKSVSEIQAAYAEQYGVKAIAIPRDQGLDRALWAVPVAAFVVAAGGLTMLGRRWVKKNQASVVTSPALAGDAQEAALDQELDDELRRLND